MQAMEKARIEDLLWVRSQMSMLAISLRPLRPVVLINHMLLCMLIGIHY